MKSINLSLTDELRAFIDVSSGKGTLYSTPSEFLRDVLREKKMRMEAATIREGIIEGYSDLIAGRYVEFTGNLNKVRSAQKKSRRKKR
jgi:antitoxin ParD1/3/4